MAEAKTANIRYIFLDIVGFTKNRSVEAQTDLVTYLNEMVNSAIDNTPELDKDNDCIFLPTGDGMCIAIIEVTKSYNIHLKVALEILKLVKERNRTEHSTMRRFEVRIGLNENEDNFVDDINGRRNVAGRGINMAQRIMDKADNSQILIGQTTFEKLRERESYLESFRGYSFKDKHGQKNEVHQYIDNKNLAVNNSVPSCFAKPEAKNNRISKKLAHYMANALVHKGLLTAKLEADRGGMWNIVMLFYLAIDGIKIIEASKYETPSECTWGNNETPIEEVYDYYAKLHFWVSYDFGEFIIRDLDLYTFRDCFEGGSHATFFSILSQEGESKLLKEWPDIWKRYRLDSA